MPCLGHVYTITCGLHNLFCLFSQQEAVCSLFGKYCIRTQGLTSSLVYNYLSQLHPQTQVLLPRKTCLPISNFEFKSAVGVTVGRQTEKLTRSVSTSVLKFSELVRAKACVHVPLSTSPTRIRKPSWLQSRSVPVWGIGTAARIDQFHDTYMLCDMCIQYADSTETYMQSFERVVCSKQDPQEGSMHRSQMKGNPDSPYAILICKKKRARRS